MFYLKIIIYVKDFCLGSLVSDKHLILAVLSVFTY